MSREDCREGLLNAKILLEQAKAMVFGAKAIIKEVRRGEDLWEMEAAQGNCASAMVDIEDALTKITKL